MRSHVALAAAVRALHQRSTHRPPARVHAQISNPATIKKMMKSKKQKKLLRTADTN